MTMYIYVYIYIYIYMVKVTLTSARCFTYADDDDDLFFRFEVSSCRNASPPTLIAPTSKLIKTEPNRPLHLSEDHRRHRRM